MEDALEKKEKPILSVDNLEVVYNEVILVLRGISMNVSEGEIVALLGANGAGKTTLLVRAGLSQVMDGRRIFAELTVEENLKAGAYTVASRQKIAEAHDRVVGLFPVLASRSRSTAGYLSGGEQQMLAIGRALMTSPRLLVLDEPSLGLAPLLVQQIRDIIETVNRQGTSVLLVEQNATMALSIANRGYVLENGRIVRDGLSHELLQDDDIKEFYLGVGEAGRRSFRDVKTYRRRKRWSA